MWELPLLRLTGNMLALRLALHQETEMRKQESIDTSISFQKVGDDDDDDDQDDDDDDDVDDDDDDQDDDDDDDDGQTEGFQLSKSRLISCTWLILQVYKVILESNEKIADDVQVAGCPSKHLVNMCVKFSNPPLLRTIGPRNCFCAQKP